MTQHNTNMNIRNYYAYCHAYVVSFVFGRENEDCMAMDIASANDAVRAGIVFG